MYDTSDPRASLVRQAIGKPAPAANHPADYARFYAEPPQIERHGERTWLARGQNGIVAVSDVEAGARLDRDDQIDEYAVILPDRETSVEIETGGQKLILKGYHLAFVPPGASKVTALTSGRILRVFTTRAEDLCALCGNAAAYAEDRANVAPVVNWPDPVGGFRIRAYDMDVAPEPGRFGRIWRSTNLMINWLDAYQGPRDPSRLSPHHHDDFEQFSVVVGGEYVHHLRWPWTTDKMSWRKDDHELCAAPSVAVIPPPAIHTSEAVGAGLNQMIDIFCPPRMDFSLKPGWVLNHGEYPMPG